MKFGNLFYLFFLWIIPVLIIFYIYSIRKRKRLLEKFASAALLPRLLNSSGKNIYFLKALLLILACTSAIIALTEPKFGYKWEEVSRKGVDIIVAVDVSNSMLAEDIKPNRLERAKRKLSDLITILQGDRIGLVAFAGTSFLQCPLTLDYDAFQIFLDYLDPSLIPVPGTSLSNALETAIKAFPKDSERNKSIILITDGEDQEKAVDNVIPTLKEKGIRVFAIGIGKEEGAPIPTDQGDFKKDENGNVVLTKLDSSTLKKIALQTNGTFVRSVSGDIDIQKIYQEGIKSNSEDKDFKTSSKKIWQERFQIFVGLALMLLCLEFLLKEQRSTRTQMAELVKNEDR
jgi:Ca-activated chloride channel family protein